MEIPYERMDDEHDKIVKDLTNKVIAMLNNTVPVNQKYSFADMACQILITALSLAINQLVKPDFLEEFLRQMVFQLRYNYRVEHGPESK